MIDKWNNGIDEGCRPEQSGYVHVIDDKGKKRDIKLVFRSDSYTVTCTTAKMWVGWNSTARVMSDGINDLSTIGVYGFGKGDK